MLLLEAEIRYQEVGRCTPVMLPYGVHFLSKESQETLRRAKEKADAATARHTKRGVLNFGPRE